MLGSGASHSSQSPLSLSPSESSPEPSSTLSCHKTCNSLSTAATPSAVSMNSSRDISMRVGLGLPSGLHAIIGATMAPSGVTSATAERTSFAGTLLTAAPRLHDQAMQVMQAAPSGVPQTGVDAAQLRSSPPRLSPTAAGESMVPRDATRCAVCTRSPWFVRAPRGKHGLRVSLIYSFPSAK